MKRRSLCITLALLVVLLAVSLTGCYKQADAKPFLFPDVTQETNAVGDELIEEGDNLEPDSSSHEHLWGEWVVLTEPTTESLGEERRTCSLCDEFENRKIEKVVSSHEDSYAETDGTQNNEEHEHSYVERVVKNASCVEDGSVIYSCSCGASYSKTIEKLSHEYDSVEIEPTCTKEGYTSHTCKRCGDTYTDNNSGAIGHAYTERTDAKPTCSDEGVKTFVCEHCGDNWSEEIARLEHSYVNTVHERTCTENGYVESICNDCGESKIVETLEALGHDYVATITAPTCTEEGYTTYVCETCGDTYVDDKTDATHNYVEEVVSEASCEECGIIVFVCSICEDSYTEETAALGHSYSLAVVAPTCKNAGYTRHTCEACGDYYDTDVIEATEHNYEEEIVREADCETNGISVFTCNSCGESYTQEIVSNGHSYSSVVIEPTCEHEGYTSYTCDVCGTNYTDNIVETIGHIYETKTVSPKCAANGYDLHSCLNCNHSYIDNEVPASGHNYLMEVVKAPTCDNDGIRTFKCENCNASYSEIINETGHNYESNVKAPTCDENGFTIHTCKDCGDEYIDEEVVANGHNYVSVVTEACCEEDGFTTHTCSVCGDSYVDSRIEAIGHSYTEEITKEATCAEAGIKTFTCEACGKSYTEIIPELKHNYMSVLTKPTCSEGGYTTYTCSNCGDSYVGDKVDEFGHEYVGAITVAATCSSEGEKTFTCKACGAAYTEIIPTENHSYVSKVVPPTCTNDGYTEHTCTYCGDSYNDSSVVAVGHNYVGVITKSPTCVELGVKTFSCEACESSYAEEISVMDHSYVSEVIASTCTDAGYTKHTCTGCGDSYVDNETPVMPHVYTEEVTKAATCTSDGIKSFTCDCGESFTQTIAATGHNYSPIVTDPSCNDAGFTTYTCVDCGDSYVDNEVLATGHSWSDWVVTKEAGENVEGAKERICNTCGKTEIEVIPEIHYHNFVVTSQTKATCTEDGVIYRACACGETNHTTIEKALGHNWESHGQAEVGHYEGYIFCHCGNWSCATADGRYHLAFADHVDNDHNGEWWDWSYYNKNVWVVDTPATNYKICTHCGTTK